jgi:plastocyanin
VNPPKLIRLLFAATVVAGVSAAPMLSAFGASTRGVDVHDPANGGFSVPEANPKNQIEINPGDTVSWTVYEGKHNITPKDHKLWGGDGSEDLTPDTNPPYSKQFKSAGDFFYFCSIHSSADDVGKDGVGMWGVVHVKDNTPVTQPPDTQPPATQPPATQPPTTTTTRPASTPPATTATAPTTAARPAPTAPATTATTAKDKKPKDPKDETTTTSSTLPPPIDLPDSAIIPTLPSAGTPGDPGAPAEAPADAPEGEAVALLKGKKDKGGDAVKLLIVSGIGLGGLGIGTGAYKYANRSSKYFPA